MLTASFNEIFPPLLSLSSSSSSSSYLIFHALQVLPVNEYTPVWKSPRLDEHGRFPPVQLSPDTPVGTIVMTTKAVDGDVGDGGDIRYSIYNISTEG